MKTVAIIPAWNEERIVASVVYGAAKYVDTVIVVDDGSTDRTATFAREAGAHVVRHAVNAGPGAATMTGIIAARRMKAEIVVMIDADGQHDPENIPHLLKPIKEGRADIVNGSRFLVKGNQIPRIRRIFNAIGNVFTYIVTGRYVTDSQSGFRALGPAAVRDIHLRLSGFEFCSEMVREIEHHTWRLVEVPVKVTYSEYTLAKGQSFSRGVITACRMLLRSFLR
jgi:glycosyltransferase involved in cell wall biosynthesis